MTAPKNREPQDLGTVLDAAFDLVVEQRVWLTRRIRSESRARAVIDMKGKLRELGRLEESLNYWRRSLGSIE